MKDNGKMVKEYLYPEGGVGQDSVNALYKMKGFVGLERSKVEIKLDILSKR